MCGKSAQAKNQGLINRLLHVGHTEGMAGYLPPSVMEPGTDVLTIRLADKEAAYATVEELDTTLRPMHWGWGDTKAGYNARIETVPITSAWKYAWQDARRCIVPSDGFWERNTFFKNSQDKPLFMAGLYSHLPDQSKWYVTVITRPADMIVRPHHARMPLLVPSDGAHLWLTSNTQAAKDAGALWSQTIDHDLITSRSLVGT